MMWDCFKPLLTISVSNSMAKTNYWGLFFYRHGVCRNQLYVSCIVNLIMISVLPTRETHDVGAVGCIRWIKSAISVARNVMERTTQTLLVGDLGTVASNMKNTIMWCHSFVSLCISANKTKMKWKDGHYSSRDSWYSILCKIYMLVYARIWRQRGKVVCTKHRPFWKY